MGMNQIRTGSQDASHCQSQKTSAASRTHLAGTLDDGSEHRIRPRGAGAGMISVALILSPNNWQRRTAFAESQPSITHG